MHLKTENAVNTAEIIKDRSFMFAFVNSIQNDFKLEPREVFSSDLDAGRVSNNGVGMTRSWVLMVKGVFINFHCIT